jgi:hypothetical protein
MYPELNADISNGLSSTSALTAPLIAKVPASAAPTASATGLTIFFSDIS